jgi:protocatechuate 3,4-dioxygenase alpha subunit
MRTPSQTVGPFFSFGLCDRPQNELPGGSLRVDGRVLDGEGAPVPDAMVEVWHPDVGFGRCGTDSEGVYSFLVPEFARLEVMVFARGLLKPVVTRLYPPGAAGAEDPTMIAVQDGEALRFDVHLQGERETAFFAV